MYMYIYLPFFSPHLVDKVPSTSLLSSGRSSVCLLSGCMTVPSEATASRKRLTVWMRRQGEGKEGKEGEGSERQIKVRTYIHVHCIYMYLWSPSCIVVCMHMFTAELPQ